MKNLVKGWGKMALAGLAVVAMLCGFMLTSGLTTTYAADTTTTTPATGKAIQHPHLHRHIKGVVIAKGDGTFTVKDLEGKDVTLKVTNETRFIKDKQDVTFNDLKVGDKVRVRIRHTPANPNEGPVAERVVIGKDVVTPTGGQTNQ